MFRERDMMWAWDALAHVRAQQGWEHPEYWAAWVLWGRSD